MPCHAEAPEVALAAVPALAQLFSAPADQASATGQTKQPSAGATSWAQSASLPADAAALQLEAMQVLLLLLPLPMPQVWYVIQSSLYTPMRQLLITHTFPIPVIATLCFAALLHIYLASPRSYQFHSMPHLLLSASLFMCKGAQLSCKH